MRRSSSTSALAVVVSSVLACGDPPNHADANTLDHGDIASPIDAPRDGAEPIDVVATDAVDDVATDIETDAADASDDVPLDSGPPPCPSPEPGTIDGMLAWGEVVQQRMASGVIAAFPLTASPSGRSAAVFTQGQQPSTPAGVVTEFTVSRCRGVIDTSVPQCYLRSVFANYNTIVSYTRPVNGWIDQETLGAQGCWAPLSEGPWYVNVRWTYATCPFASCGFSLQWTDGAY